MPGISRRNFIAGCAGASVTGALVSLPLTTWNEVLLAADNRPLQADARILVLVTMYGGNDGLNTVIPTRAPPTRTHVPTSPMTTVKYSTSTDNTD